MLAYSLTSLGVHLLFDEWCKQTLWFSYFTETVLGSLDNGSVNKIRHYVLAILVGLLMYHSIMNQWIIPDNMW